MAAEASQPTLLAIFLRFLRFGFLAWGGPVAQIGMIKRELVEEERWIEVSRFNRLLAIYQVLPGPEAHELCVHLGMMKRGRLGGLLAGIGFMLPGLALVLGMAWLYQRLDLHQPKMAATLLGIQVGVIALIVRAVHRIADHALSDRWLWGIALSSAIAAAANISFWITLPTAGLVYTALAARRYAVAALIALLALGVVAATGGLPDLVGSQIPRHEARLVQGTVSPVALLLSGLKAGLLTFGGAYTAIPFIRGDAVGRGWATDAQFLDSLALSGIIPAPLIIFATFLGYLAGGVIGALAITAGIFLPAFAFGLLFYGRLESVIENERLHGFLEGVAAGVVGLIAVTALQLGSNVARSVPELLVAVGVFSAALAVLYLWRSKLNVLGVVLGSAALGLLFFGAAA